MRIVLDETNFRDLVAGRVTKAEARRLGTAASDWPMRVELILTDIGWERMIDAIVDAMAERGISVNDLLRIVTSNIRPPPDDCE